MKNTRNIAFAVGFLMSLLTIINTFTTKELNTSILRFEVISGLSSVFIILLGLLISDQYENKKGKIKLQGNEGFYLSENIREPLKTELAWGSQMILTATASATVMIYSNNNILLRRGIISDKVFKPGKICFSSSAQSKYISLVNTRFYPGRSEFDPILNNLPAVIVFPLLKDGWLIIGGWSERCFTKSDELWIEGWSRKLSQML